MADTNYFLGYGRQGLYQHTFFHPERKTTNLSASWASGARIWVNYEQLAGVYGCLAVFQYGFTNKALKKAGNHIAKCSKRNLKASMKSPQGVTGNLLSSYAVKVKKNRTGVLVGFTKLGHHAHLVDQGHEVVVGKNKVHTGKRTKALHFHTEAKNKDMQQAMMIALAQMQKDLMQRWDKLDDYAGRGRYNPYTDKFTTASEIQKEIHNIQAMIRQISIQQDRLNGDYLDRYGIGDYALKW